MQLRHLVMETCAAMVVISHYTKPVHTPAPAKYSTYRENERSDEAWAGWPEQNSVSLPYRHGVSLLVRATHGPGQPMSQGKKWLDYYKKFAML